MKNPNLACDFFKILLTEHISSYTSDDDCFTKKPECYLDKYAIDKLITSSFSLCDQILDRIDTDPQWIALQKKNQAIRDQQIQAQQASQQPKPEPTKPEPKK